MYRPRSTAVWFNLPGVVAAYQPVGAPGSQLARINVSNEQRTPGRYMATPGVAPTFNAATGWGFNNASSTYLTTGIVPTSTSWSLLIAYANAALSYPLSLASLFGAWNSDSQAFNVSIVSDNRMRAFSGGYQNYATALLSGVYGIAGQTAYRNGIAETAAIGAGTATTRTLIIGALNTGSITQYVTCQLRALVLVARKCSASEIWLASCQMAYCHVNPDWSAWGRRRRYYYAPSVAAGRAFSPIGSGVVGSSVVRRVV